MLFGQLARLGLTAAEAARCFVQQPVTAGVASFEPATPVLAGLLTGGSKAGSGKSGEQLLGDLLRKQPSALVLLCSHQATLQQRISNLVQRYGPHWEQDNKEAVIVTAVQGQNWALLNSHPEHLLSLEAMLQQEVGQQPGDGARLLASILQHQALTATCIAPVMQQRARALVAVSCLALFMAGVPCTEPLSLFRSNLQPSTPACHCCSSLTGRHCCKQRPSQLPWRWVAKLHNGR